MNSAGSSYPVQSIAVIGGGIIGLAAAWRLAQRGFAITVYDQGTLGGEASWAGAGMLAPGGEVDGESSLAAAAIEARRMYPEFIAELERASGVAIDYQECGALELAYSVQERQQLEQRSAFQSSVGIPSKPVAEASIRAFWPRVLMDGLQAARFYPEDAIVNPRDVVSALTKVNRDIGVNLLENCPVLGLRIGADGVTVKAGDGTFEFCATIVAAGAWSSCIPIEGVAPVPAAEPVKGHILGYRQPDQTCTTIIRRAGTYLLQRSNGMLLAGASVERVGFERAVQPEIVTRLALEAAAILPHLAETTPSESWMGFRPGSDALHVCSWHSQRLYLAYGHFRNGILLAPWTAAVLADTIAASLGKR